MQRRRFSQTQSLEARLAEEARRLREAVKLLPPGPERDEMIRKARRAETGSHMSEWLRSPGLQPPIVSAQKSGRVGGEFAVRQKDKVGITPKPVEIEAALRESEQRLRWLASIVESSDDAIISKNLDGVITSWNSSAERVFGYSASDAIGQPITLVIPQDRQSEEREILTRIRRGERIDHFETVRQRKDGSLIVVSLTVSPVKDADGNIVGASKIARDISEQKRNQELISTLAREAEHRSKNLLANALATVNLSQSSTPEGLKQIIAGRIQALANVCSLFAATRWIGAELSAIATQELAPYSETNRKRTFINGPQTMLEPDTAQAIAITLHELATNAAKYGALSAPNGQVRLEWSQAVDGRLRLRWMETGGPVAQEPTRKGLGGRIIERMISEQKGEVRFDWRKDGLVCEITLPV
jgi:PAS domain S-box-containing protein